MIVLRQAKVNKLEIGFNPIITSNLSQTIKHPWRPDSIDQISTNFLCSIVMFCFNFTACCPLDLNV